MDALAGLFVLTTIVIAMYSIPTDGVSAKNPHENTEITMEAIIGYSTLYDLVNDSQLIVLGKIIDKTSAAKIGLFSGVTDNIIQVQKVIEGQYPNKTIDMVTEGYPYDPKHDPKPMAEDYVTANVGENAYYFLSKEPYYYNHWTIVGMDQGSLG